MTGRIKIIRKTTSVVDGSRRNRIFSHVGAMSRVWEQTRNTMRCR